MEKTIKIVRTIFSLIGVLMIGVALWSSWSTWGFLQSAARSSGEVVEVLQESSRNSNGGSSRMYRPVVRYKTTDGQEIEFTSSIASSPPAYRVGETVEVLYVPSDPNGAKIADFTSMWLLPTISGGLGLVFFGVGMGMILAEKRRKERIERLKVSGQALKTVFQSVERNESFKVNGRSPWQVLSQWNDGQGNVVVFKSDNLWFDPSAYLKKDQTITVLIEPGNPKRYYMDVEFLPKLKP